jgi:hypothetical protein
LVSQIMMLSAGFCKAFFPNMAALLRQKRPSKQYFESDVNHFYFNVQTFRYWDSHYEP